MNATFQASKAPTQTPTPTARGVLQRQCVCGDSAHTHDEEDARKNLRVQRFAANDAGLETVPPIVHDVLNSPGASLDADTRAFMEPRLGYDFSRVPPHANGPAPMPARLTVGAPHGDFEQEAERMAQYVMSQSAASTSTGYDLSGVRIHNDGKAAESARAVMDRRHRRRLEVCEPLKAVSVSRLRRPR